MIVEPISQDMHLLEHLFNQIMGCSWRMNKAEGVDQYKNSRAS